MSDRDARLSKKVQTAPQQIATLISEAILEGSLLTGARLPSEQEMADNFGVSRPTIREALRHLKAGGLITATRGRNGGHCVSEFSASTLGLGMGQYMTLAIGARSLAYADITEVRSELELLSAETAAQRRTPEDLAALDELDSLYSVGKERSGTVQEALRYDLTFHRRLAECSHNPLIVAFAGATIIAFQGCGFDIGMFSATGVLAHLHEVRQAVAEGDPKRAREAMREHLKLSNALCTTAVSPRA